MISSGSESIVFKLDYAEERADGRRASRLVLKAITDRTLRHLDDDVPPTPEYMKFLATELEMEKALMEEGYALPIEAFGMAVPRTRFRVVSIPLSLQHIQAERPNWLKSGQCLPKKMPLLLAVQRRISWKEDRLDIQGNVNSSRDFFLHSSEVVQEEFCVAHRSITAGSAKETMERAKPIFAAYPEIKTVMGQITTREQAGDQKVRPALNQAIRSLIEFVNTSRIPVDVMGSKNLIVQKEEVSGDWNLKCLDALPIERERLDELVTAVQTLSQEHLEKAPRPMTQKTKERLSFILNTVLVLNGYAICLGLADRVEVPGLAGIKPEMWLEVLRVEKPKKGN